MAGKDVAFKIRVDEELRRELIEVCQAEDTPAAQIVRKFMREYVSRRHEAMQHSPSHQQTGRCDSRCTP